MRKLKCNDPRSEKGEKVCDFRMLDIDSLTPLLLSPRDTHSLDRGLGGD